MRSLKGTRGTAATRIKGPGANLDWPYPQCYSFMFTNMMKQHGNYLRSAGSYVEDATTGWPQAVAAGQNVRFFLTHGWSQVGFFTRPGVYEARVSAAMSALGWTCQFVDESISPGTGLLSIGAAGSTCTCTVTNLGTSGDYNGIKLSLRVSAPGSAGPYNFTPNDSTAVECYLQSNKTRLDNFDSDPVTNYANMFDPDLITDCTGLKVLRFKDWLGTDIAFLNDTNTIFSDGLRYRSKQGITAYSMSRQEAFRTWQMPTSAQYATNAGDHTLYAVGGQVPYSVCAKLARATGTAAFISLPAMYAWSNFDVDATTDTFTAYGHSLQNDDPIVFPNGGYLPSVTSTALAYYTVYYVVSSSPGATFKLARTVGGAAIDITSTSADSGAYNQNVARLYSHAEYLALYTSIAQEMHAVAPNIDIILDVSNEVWNTPQPYGYHQFADVVTTNAGANRNAGSGYAWACMRAWSAFESVYPRNQIVRMLSGQGGYPANPMHSDMYNYSDAVLFGGTTAGHLIDAHCAEAYVYSQMTGQRFPAGDGGATTAQDTYGGTWHSGVAYTVGEVIHMPDGNNYRCILNNTSVDPTNKPPNGTYWTVDSSNTLTGLMKDYTDAQWNDYIHQATLSNAFWRQDYKTAQDAYIGARSIGFLNYESGLNMTGQGNAFFAFPDVVAVGASWQAHKLTASAATDINYFGAMLQSVPITTSVYYIAAGQWRGNSALDDIATGIKRSHHLPTNAAWTAWKAVTL